MTHSRHAKTDDFDQDTFRHQNKIGEHHDFGKCHDLGTKPRTSTLMASGRQSLSHSSNSSVAVSARLGGGWSVETEKD
jgi:hypothetical protein